MGILTIIGVVVLVFILGGKYTRGALAGLAIGLFGGSELNVLEASALIAVHDVNKAEGQNAKLYAEEAVRRARSLACAKRSNSANRNR
jgi:hypothetical protein